MATIVLEPGLFLIQHQSGSLTIIQRPEQLLQIRIRAQIKNKAL